MPLNVLRAVSAVNLEALRFYYVPWHDSFLIVYFLIGFTLGEPRCLTLRRFLSSYSLPRLLVTKSPS